ncbi:MAG: phage scaffolding protein [Eubacteriales bacterium]
MTLAEILKANGVGDEAANAILEAMKTNKIYTASEENLDIRYGKLKTDHESKLSELTEAQKLIAELKKSTKDSTGLQEKIIAYEKQIEQLQTELRESQINGEINAALLAAGVKADDMDYVTFKLKSKGALELGDDGHLKGIDDKIAALKTQLPAHFDGAATKKVLVNRLPGNDDGGEPITREQFEKMGYASRVELKRTNPEQYSQLMKG